MYRKMTALTLAGLAMHSSGALASDMFSFNAYGTIGVVHSSEDKADFVGTVFQPNGVGYTESTSFNPDSKVAAQIQGKFSDQWSAIVQVVSQHQYDGTYMPQVEWANVKYSPTKNLDIRAGRIVLPVFLFSESRNVGYSNPWLRAPQEIYSINTITSNDGADVTYRHKFGHALNTAQVFYGRAKVKIPGNAEMSAKPNWGFNDSLTSGDVTVRVGYVSQKVDLETNSFDPIFNGLRGLGAAMSAGFPVQSAQAYALVDKYAITNLELKDYTIGVNYDPGKWFVIAEGAKTTGDSIISDATSWYVSGGYRVDKFTPYATFASTKADLDAEPGIDTTGLSGGLATGAAQLNGGINSAKNSASAKQTTTTLGLRWDVHSHAALKLQYDRINLGTNSKGRLSNTQPSYQPGGSVNLVSAAVDFVF